MGGGTCISCVSHMPCTPPFSTHTHESMLNCSCTTHPIQRGVCTGACVQRGVSATHTCTAIITTAICCSAAALLLLVMCVCVCVCTVGVEGAPMRKKKKKGKGSGGADGDGGAGLQDRLNSPLVTLAEHLR